MAAKPSDTCPVPLASLKVKGPAKGGTATVKFGNVTVSSRKPSPEVVRVNIARGTEALERLSKTLTKPGVRLPEKKGVPRYWADDEKPGLIIRRLDGRTSSGRLQNGRFVESE